MSRYVPQEIDTKVRRLKITPFYLLKNQRKGYILFQTVTAWTDAGAQRLFAASNLYN